MLSLRPGVPLSSLPLRSKRWWIPASAVAAVIIGIAIAIWTQAGHYGDPGKALARHHDDHLAGQFRLSIVSPNPAELASYFEGRLGFRSRIEKPLPPEVSVVGARLCYLEGTPMAFYVFHVDRRVIIAGLFPTAELDRFSIVHPDGTRENEPLLYRVDDLSFGMTCDSERVVSVIGKVPAEQLKTISDLFDLP